MTSEHNMLPEQSWFLCENPERPLDSRVLVHVECPTCVRVIRITAMSNRWNAPLSVDDALSMSGPGGKLWIQRRNEQRRNAQ